jgi:arsenate reductase
MAEGLARHLLGSVAHVQSAGSRPTRVNPLALEAMREVGIDITSHCSKSVDSLAAEPIDVVVTLCEDEVCPASLRHARRLHWPVPDPATDDPTVEREELLERFRRARDLIGERIERHRQELLQD